MGMKESQQLPLRPVEMEFKSNCLLKVEGGIYPQFEEILLTR